MLSLETPEFQLSIQMFNYVRIIYFQQETLGPQDEQAFQERGGLKGQLGPKELKEKWVTKEAKVLTNTKDNTILDIKYFKNNMPVIKH